MMSLAAHLADRPISGRAWAILAAGVVIGATLGPASNAMAGDALTGPSARTKPPSPEAEAPSAPAPPADEKEADRQDKADKRKARAKKKRAAKDDGRVKDDRQGSPAQDPTTQPPSSETTEPKRAPEEVLAPAGGSAIKVKAGGTYTVERGDSLWSIAAHLVGKGASPAKIDKVTDQLWALNSKRIGTGSPDLIYAGQQLRVPA
jgi:nucleoid-associated protein YgaU